MFSFNSDTLWTNRFDYIVARIAVFMKMKSFPLRLFQSYIHIIDLYNTKIIQDVASGKSILFAPKLPSDYAVWSGEIKPLSYFKVVYGNQHLVYYTLLCLVCLLILLNMVCRKNIWSIWHISPMKLQLFCTNNTRDRRNHYCFSYMGWILTATISQYLQILRLFFPIIQYIFQNFKVSHLVSLELIGRCVAAFAASWSWNGPSVFQGSFIMLLFCVLLLTVFSAFCLLFRNCYWYDVHIMAKENLFLNS